MRRWMTVCLLLVGSLALARMATAQDASKQAEGAKAEAPVHYYHLQFVVQELNAEGKPTNSRTYTTTVSTEREESTSIRSGSRVPVATGSFSSGSSNALVNTQFQYIDMGVNIDARRVREIDHQLALFVKAEVSSQGAAVELSNIHEPVIRHNNWQSVVLIPIGKATTIFTSDSLDSTGSMRMVLTATPIP